MDEELKKGIERWLKQDVRARVERVAATDANHEQEVTRLYSHVKSSTERHISDMYDQEDAAEAAAHPGPTVNHFGGLQTPRQLTKHALSRLNAELARPLTTLEYKVPAGSRIFSPPYDTVWIEGFGFDPIFSPQDGSVITLSKENALSAAGVGFFLTTDQPVLAAITPQGEYAWNWISFMDLPFARTRGGMGITIYTDSQPEPTLSREQVLWDASGFKVWQGAAGSGRIADAASPAFGFGTVPLAPALLNMVPGSRYLVWVWCWQLSLGRKQGDSCLAFMQFKMPFVSINAGPPLIIR